MQSLTRERESLGLELESERNAKLSAQKVLLTVNESNFELMAKAREFEERYVKAADSKKESEVLCTFSK